MIELRNIDKSYGTLKVLKNISLDISDGELMAIVGPSGAGKTTLLQVLGTLETPDRGEVRYDGVEVSRLKDKAQSRFRNRNIGFVFQFHQLLPEFTACENVALPAMIAGESKKSAMKKAAALLEKLGLGDRLSHKPAQLSGGERQRTAIARALINDPAIILADEPTGSLDSHNRDEIRDLMAKVSSEFGQTVVMVTHDETMAAVADTIVRMNDGIISEIQKKDVTSQSLSLSNEEEL